jgi:lipopolysaccharide transport system ATP-binding protein
MREIAIKVEDVSKRYRLGVLGRKSIKDDFKLLFLKCIKNKDFINQEIVENDRTKVATSNYVWSLKDVNFEIEKGDVVGIIGRNGAGKSTLLKILSRITSPTTGNIKIKGKVASLLEVGTGFHPELTGRENIYLNGAILGMSKAEINNKLNDIIEFAEVQSYIDTPVKRYSSGMYVRLAFSIAAHLEPDILIIDEVLAVGDASFQKKCLDKMKEISEKDGRTILFVSHSMASIQNLCKKGIVMNNGKVQFYGLMEEAVTNYLSYDNSSIQSNIEFDENQRVGSGEIKITSIIITDDNDNEIDLIPSGQSVKVVLRYLNSNPEKKYSLVVGLVFKSQFDVPISLHHSRIDNQIYDYLPEKGEFIFSIKNFPFVPSKYLLDYSLVDHGVIIDSMKSQLQLNVIEGNYYGNGEVVPSSHGIFLLNAKWSIK